MPSVPPVGPPPSATAGASCRSAKGVTEGRDKTVGQACGSLINQWSQCLFDAALLQQRCRLGERSLPAPQSVQQQDCTPATHGGLRADVVSTDRVSIELGVVSAALRHNSALLPERLAGVAAAGVRAGAYRLGKAELAGQLHTQC